MHRPSNLGYLQTTANCRLQGAVVNVSSVGAIMPIASPTMTSYGVAKAAQDTLTKNLAFEFATKGVRVNSVLPGEPLFLSPPLTIMHLLTHMRRRWTQDGI